MTATGLEVAFAFRSVAVGLLFASVVLLARAWVRGVLQETLAYSVLKAARRSGITTSLMVIAVCLALTGLMTAAMDLGYVPEAVAQPIGGVTFLAASIATFALTWIGLTHEPTPPELTLVLDAPEGYVASVGAVDRAAGQRSAPDPR